MQYAKFNLMSKNPFGDLVKTERERLNLSQRELAQKCGLSNSYINYVETGVNPAAKDGIFRPGRKSVLKIIKFLKLDETEALNAAGFAAPINPPKTTEIPVDTGFSLLFYKAPPDDNTLNTMIKVLQAIISAEESMEKKQQQEAEMSGQAPAEIPQQSPAPRRNLSNIRSLAKAKQTDENNTVVIESALTLEELTKK